MEKEEQKDVALDLQAKTIDSLFAENTKLKAKINFIEVVVKVAENLEEKPNPTPFDYGWNKGSKFIAGQIKEILEA